MQTLNLSGNHLTNYIVDLSSLNLPAKTFLHCIISNNDFNLIASSPPFGPANIGTVSNMNLHGITVSWHPQNTPSIKSKIPDKMDPAGGADPFTVEADGAPPMYFQWQFDGTNLTDNGQIRVWRFQSLSFAVVEFANEGSQLEPSATRTVPLQRSCDADGDQQWRRSRDCQPTGESIRYREKARTMPFWCDGEQPARVSMVIEWNQSSWYRHRGTGHYKRDFGRHRYIHGDRDQCFGSVTNLWEF